MNERKRRRRTALVQTGIGEDKTHRAIIPPLYLSSTFQVDDLHEKPTYDYSRTNNPNRDFLANILTEMEMGAGACVTSSGMAALNLILHLLNPEDLIVVPYDCYGRSHRLLSALSEKGHFRVKFVDQYNPEEIEAMFAEPPRMVMIETPSNPLMRIADIKTIAGRAKTHGALVVVDNTFMTPMLMQPIALGADIVYHSTTKFLNGHSDVIGGAVIAASQDIHEELFFWNNSLGTIGAPFDAHMILRGLRTLEVRMSRSQENAQAIAEFLNAHPLVETVYYPGLPDHTGFEIAEQQQEGPGAILSFEIKGTFEDVNKFAGAMKIFRLAQSLGGTESLINHPATMTHVSMGEEARAKAGITDQLVRVSVGIEHIIDLTADMAQAFQQIGKTQAIRTT